MSFKPVVLTNAKAKTQRTRKINQQKKQAQALALLNELKEIDKKTEGEWVRAMYQWQQRVKDLVG